MANPRGPPDENIRVLMHRCFPVRCSLRYAFIPRHDAANSLLDGVPRSIVGATAPSSSSFSTLPRRSAVSTVGKGDDILRKKLETMIELIDPNLVASRRRTLEFVQPPR